MGQSCTKQLQNIYDYHESELWSGRCINKTLKREQYLVISYSNDGEESCLNFKKRRKYINRVQYLLKKIENFIEISIEEIKDKYNSHEEVRKIIWDFSSDDEDESPTEEHTVLKKLAGGSLKSDSFISIHSESFIDISNLENDSYLTDLPKLRTGSTEKTMKQQIDSGYEDTKFLYTHIQQIYDNTVFQYLPKGPNVKCKVECNSVSIDSGLSLYDTNTLLSTENHESLNHLQEQQKLLLDFRASLKKNEAADYSCCTKEHTRKYIRSELCKEEQKSILSAQVKAAFYQYFKKLLEEFFKDQNLYNETQKSFSIETYIEKFDEYFSQNYSLSTLTEKGKHDTFKILNIGVEFARYDRQIQVYPINGLQQYFEQMSVPLASRPAHAETMRYEWVRVRSFWSFPSNIRVSPIAMARVGFYYTGKCAECRCFCCGHVYKEWKDGDDPYLIHQQISPTCFYLNGRESGNVPIHEEDRITPRHNVEQSMVSVTAPVNAARAAAEVEAVVIPGINSVEIASITVPALPPIQGEPLGAIQSGDFSFRLPTASSAAHAAVTTTQQASSSYFARPANPNQNVGQPAASASLQGRTSNLSPTKSSSSLPTTQSQQASTTQQFNISGQQNVPQQSTEGSTRKHAVGIGLPNTSQFSEGSVLSGPVLTSSPATVTQTPASVTVPTTVTVSSTPTAVSSTQPSQVTLTSSTTSNAGGISRSPSSSSALQTASPAQTTTTTSTSTSTSSSSTTVGSESSRSRFDPLGINFEKPRYPAYAVLTVRVNTYNGWPSYLDQTPRTMSLAGFFYAGYGDYTRCFFCGGGLRNWEAGDDPWVEHARWFPKCAFLRQNRGEDFINMVQTRHQEAESTNQPILLPRQLSVLDQGMPSNVMSSIPVQTLREMGKEDGIINEAIDRWRAARRQEGRGNDNMEMQATAIYEIILQIEDERAQITTQSSSLLPAQTSSQLSIAERNEPAAGGEGTSAELPSYLQGFDKILDEYEEQKERLTCTICTENPVAIAFLPCGHLVCCLDCAPAMRKCPICNELVKGTIKTFFP